jgi:hypothetical protein
MVMLRHVFVRYNDRYRRKRSSNNALCVLAAYVRRRAGCSPVIRHWFVVVGDIDELDLRRMSDPFRR